LKLKAMHAKRIIAVMVLLVVAFLIVFPPLMMGVKVNLVFNDLSSGRHPLRHHLGDQRP